MDVILLYMAFPEPPRDWQDKIHRRIMQNDATAFAELCESALPALVKFLQDCFSEPDSHLCESTAIDCLLSYYRTPKIYNPKQISLFAYLRMAARYDLMSAVNKEARLELRLTCLDELADGTQAAEADDRVSQAALDALLERHTDWSFAEIAQALESHLDRVEKRCLWLMLEGVRDNARYVGALGLAQMDEAGQRAEVKRVKDRLVKKLQRFGESIRAK
jgi:DNA-directed RNA polymerase specialized sigma24 family protein